MSEEPITLDFNELLPSMTSLFNILLWITVSGFFLFPLIALTIQPEFAIHFWVLLGIDAGLFFALLK